MKQKISMGSPKDRRFEQKVLISLCEIFCSHIFRAFWNLWNVLRKCLDIELLYRYRSLTFSNALLTKGRPLEARHQTKDFNGKPGRPWIWAKTLSISVYEKFYSHIFRAFWNLWNVLRKCLDIELLYRYPSLMVFHGLLTKGRPLEAPHETKDFNGKPGRPWIWAKNIQFHFARYFSSFLKPIKYFAKMLRYWVTVQISKSDGLPRSPNKRKTVRSSSWNKRFHWEARKAVDFDKKFFNFTLRDIFLPSFSRFLKPMKYFAKMLSYWDTVQISKSDGLPRSSNKRKTVRSPSWNKGFL